MLNHFEFGHDFKNVRLFLWVHVRPPTQKGSRSVVSPAKNIRCNGVLLTYILTSEHHFRVPMFSHLLPCPLGNHFFKFLKQVLELAKISQIMATELSRLTCFTEEVQRYHHNLLRFGVPVSLLYFWRRIPESDLFSHSHLAKHAQVVG